MQEDIKAMFDSLKELINTKFEELEKRQKIEIENQNLRFEAIVSKNKEQDTRIDNLEGRLAENKKKPEKTLDQIKSAIIKWAIPFIFAAVIYFIYSGGYKK